MSAPAVLIANAKVRPGQSEAFAAWKARHDIVIGKFAGFISSDIIPPTQPDSNEWTIVLNFRTSENLAVWQKSEERAQILAEAMPLLEGGTIGEVAQPEVTGEAPGTNVTEVILSRIKPGMDDRYREWAVRIQAAQARYPGYRGMYLQPPSGEGGLWTTIIRFDTSEHLEAWMAAPERAELLRESKEFIEHEELMRLATSFPGWVPVNPMTGKGPPNWKTAMLVLLGLFPIVMLELKFLSPQLAALGIHASLGTFIGNALSVAATSFITMPWCVRWFGWWLFPEEDEAKAVTPKGLGVLAMLYAIEVAVLWKLLPW